VFVNVIDQRLYTVSSECAERILHFWCLEETVYVVEVSSAFRERTFVGSTRCVVDSSDLLEESPLGR